MKIDHNSKLFIVDDDPFWTALLKQILTGLGYNNVTSFENGAGCISNLHLNPAVIFLDYEMKEMNGLEVLKEVMLYNDKTYVVFCSDQREISVAVEAMKKGSFDYLKKSSTLHSDVELVLRNLSELK
jgi:DNA-binding NtrC family response regulator